MASTKKNLPQRYPIATTIADPTVLLNPPPPPNIMKREPTQSIEDGHVRVCSPQLRRKFTGTPSLPRNIQVGYQRRARTRHQNSQFGELELVMGSAFGLLFCPPRLLAFETAPSLVWYVARANKIRLIIAVRLQDRAPGSTPS